MPVVGIIAEYNPLHRGHEYHIEQARKLTDASACVCVLSSNFVQRGEPAIINKWARAKMALQQGADLVIELPSAFSCASAEYFASCAVQLLGALDCVDYLCFGSEEGQIETFEKAAALLANESEEFKYLLKQGLDKGLSFAAAREKAAQIVLSAARQGEDFRSDALGGSSSGPLLNMPNNILGIEYMKAIKRAGCPIKPLTIKRIGQGYKSALRAHSLSSATAIRSHISNEPPGNIRSDSFLINNLSPASLEILSEEFVQGRGPIFPEAFENIFLHLVRSAPKKALASLPYMGEGLENRLKDAAIKSTSLKELVSSAVTSRYPASRIKRILCALLTGLTAELLDTLKNNGYAQYIRILGFNDRGRSLLSGLRKKAQLPVITKPADGFKLKNPHGVSLFEHEIRATDSYVLGCPSARARKGGLELTTSPIYWKAD
ncbi:MAG TPA: nucleotidyltransferase [Ruminiclostridium sp.]|nr:nucleotidyltransferase [Ruminiclostridium sp.]